MTTETNNTYVTIYNHDFHNKHNDNTNLEIQRFLVLKLAVEGAFSQCAVKYLAALPRPGDWLPQGGLGGGAASSGRAQSAVIIIFNILINSAISITFTSTITIRMYYH